MSATASKFGLRGLALGYLALLLVIPVGAIFYQMFAEGLSAGWESITSPQGSHAFWLTIITVVISVPINAFFGVMGALVLVRHKFRGKAFLNALIDIPFAVSPVVIGLALVLLYGPRDGFLGEWFASEGIRIIFSTPGIILATLFVSLPFVVREVVPVLQEIGDDQEWAAKTLGANNRQIFWRITLPAIRWGVTYGVVLSTARVLGEFGAVSVVSGKISGQTETVPLYVSKSIEVFDFAGAYMASVVLALIALATLFAMKLSNRKEAT